MKMMIYDDSIREAYKDIRDPDYSFVRRALEAGRHKNIGSALVGIGFSVVDDTDPNTDVCRTLIVAKEGFQAAVKISFAGPFGAVFRLHGTDNDMQRISSLLQENDISVLSDDVLSKAFEISLFDLDEQPTVYNALFATDPMPS